MNNLNRHPWFLAAIVSITTATARLQAAGSAEFTFHSPQADAILAPGQLVEWSIEVDVSEGDNLGLALVLVDLVQSPFNPDLIDLPQADSVPAVMAGFAAPAGYSNPGDGYLGSRAGNFGERNLRQIGGAQNSFGAAGVEMGQDVSVETGIGQTTPVVIASGSFAAPAEPGTYFFGLENAVANTFESIGTPPAASVVSSAATFFDTSGIFFTVDADAHLQADVNCDGTVNGRDIAAFALAQIDAAAFAIQYPGCPLSQADVNGDASVNTGDITEFVACVLAGGCP